MSKKTKKRNKPYRGEDAAVQQPTVHRYKAVERSPLSEWWQSRKKLAKVIGIIAVVILVVAFIISELVRLAV